MLDRLINYAASHGLEAEPGFEPKTVKWAIQCDEEGRFLEVIELGDVSQKRNRGREFAKCPSMSQPEMKAGGVTKSHFLVDTAEVVALLGPRVSDLKVQSKHEYFISLLEQASSAERDLALLATTLQDSSQLDAIRSRLEEQKARPTDKVTLRFGDRFPVESKAWHDWWRQFRATLETSRSKEKARKKRAADVGMRCFASGDLVEPAPTHPKIEGLTDVGGLSMGDVLIGFKQESFRSYGLDQSANASVSESAASAYRAALNELIKRRGRKLAGAKVVHWFRDKVPAEDDLLPWLEEPADAKERGAQQRAKALLESIRTGQRPDLGGNEYYALTLSGAGGRVMVRDWMEGAFEDLVAGIHNWFDDLSIVARDGRSLASSPKFLAVLGATVRDLKELAPPFVSRVWRAAVRTEPLPQLALAHTLVRVRSDVLRDQPFNHARMGLLRAYSVRQMRKKGDNAMAEEIRPRLNADHSSPAYQCGRLMAVLAGLQRAALGDVGAGVVQRYYAAASSTPALVFGRLTRTSQFHLSKLTPGLAYWYESRLTSIWSRLRNQLPTTLSLEEQSLFALGYYQQMAELRTKKTSDDTDMEEPDK